MPRLRTTYPRNHGAGPLPESVHDFSPRLGRGRAETPSAAPPFDSTASDGVHVPELYGELQESADSLSGTPEVGTSTKYGREERRASEPLSDPADGRDRCSKEYDTTRKQDFFNPSKPVDVPKSLERCQEGSVCCAA